MRNLIILLAILTTGMALAQRPDIVSKTISGTTYNVSTVGTGNVLTITGSNPSGMYNVVDGAFLDELYATNADNIVSSSIDILISDLIPQGRYHDNSERPISNIRLTDFSWTPNERHDRSDVLESVLPTTDRGTIRFLNSRRGILDNEFILTIDFVGYTDVSYTVTLNDDGTYTAFEHIVSSIYDGTTGVYYSEGDDCIPLNISPASDYDVLKSGIYTMIQPGNRLYVEVDENGYPDLAPIEYSNSCGS